MFKRISFFLYGVSYYLRDIITEHFPTLLKQKFFSFQF